MNKPLTFNGPASGFPEYLPAQQRVFDAAVATIRNVYESFGYTPLETAAVERVETVLSKGIDAKEVYGLRRLAAEDGDGGKDLALRFDLTVPFARYVAQNRNELVFPFRRYQVQPVWRGERAQAGRYRQFYQFDIDCIADGELPLAVDAEVIAAGYTALRALSPGKFTVYINNRNILYNLLTDMFNFSEDQIPQAIKLIDGLSKVGREKTKKLLEELRGDEQHGDVFLDIFLTGQGQSIPQFIEKFRNETGDYDFYAQLNHGLTQLQTLHSHLCALLGPEVVNSHFQALPTIARGLDYYTGTVVETTLDEAPELGSIMSGGRYDDLAANLGKKQLPGVGISIGLSRLMSHLLTKEGHQMAATPATVLVACQDDAVLETTTAIARQLRQAGLNVEQHFGGQSLGTQLKNADKRGIGHAVIVGAEEATAATAVLKDLRDGTQQTLPVSKLADVLKG